MMLKSLSIMQVMDLITNLKRIMPSETIIKSCASWDDKLSR